MRLKQKDIRKGWNDDVKKEQINKKKGAAPPLH